MLIGNMQNCTESRHRALGLPTQDPAARPGSQQVPKLPLVYDNSSFGLQLLVHILMHFNDVAGRIIEEDLIPAVHRPLAIVGIGDVLLLEPLLESFNVIGAESDVAAVKRIDDLIGSEADAEVGRGQMKLGMPSVAKATGAE